MYRSFRFLVVCLAIIVAHLTGAGAALAQKAVVKDGSMNFGNIRYFMNNALVVELGSYGEKKKPLGNSYLEVQQHVAFKDLKVSQPQIVEIDYDKSNTNSLEGGLKKAGAHIKGGVTVKSMREGHQKLVFFYVLNLPMRNHINEDPIALRNLDSFGGNARVCHQVFVVLESETAKKISSTGTLTASKNGNSLSLTHKSKSETTVVLSPGTTFAYLLLQIDWDRNSKNLRIEKMTDDQHGLN